MTSAEVCEGMAARVCQTNGAAEIDDVARPTRLLRTNVLAREWLLRRSTTDARADAPLTPVGLAAAASVTLAVQCVDTSRLAMQVNLLLAPHSSINGATFGYALVDFVVAKFICEPINSVDRLNARFLLDEASGELVVLSWNKGDTLSLLWFTTPAATREVFPAEGRPVTASVRKEEAGQGEELSSRATDFLLRELVIFDDPGPGLRVPTKVRNRIAFRPPSPCPPCVRCMKRCGGQCGEAPLRDRPPKPRVPSPGGLPQQGTPTSAASGDHSSASTSAAVRAAGTSAAVDSSHARQLNAAAKAAVALDGGEDVPPDTCSSVSTGPDPTALYTDVWDVPEPVDMDQDVRLAVEWDRAANSRFDNMELVLPDPAWSAASEVSSGSPPSVTVSPLYDSYESGLAAQLQRSVLDAKTGGAKRAGGGGVLTSPTNFLGFSTAVALFQSSSHALMCGLWACPQQGPSRMVARSLVGVYTPSVDDQQSLRIRASEALVPTLDSPAPSLAAPPPGSSDFVRAVPLLARLLRQQHRIGTIDAAALSDEERVALRAVSGGVDLSTAVATIAGLLSVEGAPLLLASALEDDGGARSRGGSGSGGSGGAPSGAAGGEASASVRGGGGAANSGSGGGGGDSGGVDQADGHGEDRSGKKRRRVRKNLEELAHNTILYNRAIRNRESARRSNERRKLRRQAARSEAAATASPQPPPPSSTTANGTKPEDAAIANPPPPVAVAALPVVSVPSSSSGGDAGGDDRSSISAAAAAAAALAAVAVPAGTLPIDVGLAKVADEEMLLLESALLSELPTTSFAMEKPLPWPEDSLTPSQSGPLFPGV
ncbi:hypothetical protein MMPV_003633 [Pyropia vietnamensis]